MLLPLIAGCKNGGEDNESKLVSGPEGFVPHLGKADYSGKTLRVLASHKDAVFGASQIAPIENESEIVNDAFMNRNDKLEEEYGFKIEAIYTDSFDKFTARVKDDIFAGSDDYDVISSGVMALAPLVTENILIDLKTIEGSHLRLDQEWWDVASHSGFTIGNKLFFATGDIFVTDDENTVVTYFNKDLISKYNLDSPYTLVKEGTWTLDRMYEMAKTVAKEDGDGEMNVTGNDVWGLVGGAFEAYKYILGCNCPQVFKDENDIPYLGMTQEKSIDACTKVFEMFTDRSTTAYIEQYYAWDHADASKVVDNFYSGQALFYAAFMYTVNSGKMRETKVNYGILPQPKFDENQEKYTSTINPYAFYCLSITNQEHDLDFITFALEAMAYTSRVLVTPEYYQRTLQLKRFDDEESPEMLDIIFQNRIVDLSVIYNWSDCIQWYNKMLFSKNNNVVSFVEGRKSAFDKELQETIDSILSRD